MLNFGSVADTFPRFRFRGEHSGVLKNTLHAACKRGVGLCGALLQWTESLRRATVPEWGSLFSGTVDNGLPSVSEDGAEP
ncbi:MAG: hypothetical protein RLZZ458_705 [Planctomycetota bacterium]